MTARESEQRIADSPLEIDVPGRASPSMGRLRRRDTGSSIDSSLCKPIPPGFYTIPLHGNCPRCHHRHKAATVKVEISTEHSRASRIHCEKCDEKWLAMGGSNSTCVSLLSTLSTVPDQSELNARHALIDIMRSISVVGSPIALSTVAEASPAGPSRVSSFRTPVGDQQPVDVPADALDSQQQTGTFSGPQREPRAESTASTVHASQSAVARTITSEKRPLKGRIVARLKRELKTRFPTLSRKFKTFNSKHRTAQGKALTDKTRERPRVDRLVDEKKSTIALPAAVGSGKPLPAPPKVVEPREVDSAESRIDPIDHLTGKPDKEKLRSMTEKERINWVRKQFTEQECRCPKDCHCKPAASSEHRTSAPDTSIPVSAPRLSQDLHQIPIYVPPLRRHSSEYFFTGVGAQYEMTFSIEGIPPGPLSIASTPRSGFSQAATVVNSDSMTATSGEAHIPFSDMARQERHPTQSPWTRATPATSSRLRQEFLQDDDMDGRFSDDSFTPGGAVASLPSRASRDVDVHSATSLSLVPAAAPTGTDDDGQFHSTADGHDLHNGVASSASTTP